MKLSAHLDTFPLDLSVPERIAKFAELGFPGFEFWCWWQDKFDVDEIADTAQKNRIEVAALCTKFIPLVDPEQREEYLKGLQETIAVCRKLNCRCIISQVGNEMPEQTREVQKESIVAGLKESVKLLEGTGLTLVIEPLNTLVNHKGYFLWRSDEAAEIVEGVGSESVKMLFDIYHQQIMEGNILSNIGQFIELIGHFHCAGVPGRHQLVGCELDYRTIFKAIDDTGYDGYMGLEFFPQGDGASALQQALTLVE